jgi:hypothetical protein
MSIDLLGFGNTDNAVTARPARSITRGTSDTWAQNCSSPDSDDGTANQADVINDLLAQLRVAIRSAGVVQDNADDMLWKAMQSIGIRAVADTGTASDIVINPAIPIGSLFFGLTLLIKANAAPSGAANITVPVNGSDVTKALKWGGGDDISTGDYAAGAILLVVYDSTKWQLLSRVNGGSGTGSGGALALVPGCLYGFMTETVPDGVNGLVMNGAAVSRTGYSRLFNRIGTMYGPGDGTTTFNIPSVGGEFMRFLDGGANRDPDRASRTNRGDGQIGDKVGTKQVSAAGAISISGENFEIIGPTVDLGDGSGYATLKRGQDGGEAGTPGVGLKVFNQLVGSVAKLAGAISFAANVGSTETRPRNFNALPVIGY